jgi:hypothetical protein
MISRGLSTAAIRLSLVALDRLAAILDPTADRSVFCRQLRATPRGHRMRDKISRLRWSNDLLAIGCELMESAEQMTKGSRSAVRYRNGMIVALMSQRPYRLGVYCLLDVVLDPRRSEHYPHPHLTRAERYEIVCPKPHGETRRPKHTSRSRDRRRPGGGKHAPLLLPFPAELDVQMARYLETYRPILLRGACPALWVSNRGTRLSRLQTWKHVRHLTRSCPQLFRDSYATTLEQLQPGTSGHRTLGHTPFTHYDRYVARTPEMTIAAARRAGAILDKLAQGGLSKTDIG